MPNARNTGQRIRTGLQTAASMTSTYEVEALPVQSDQTDAEWWTIASDGTTVPRPARLITNADLSVSADGFLEFEWRMSYMTFGMVDYWLTTFLPSSAQDADVTVMTYNERDVAMYVQCRMRKPVFPSADAQIAPGGYSVIWRFRKGVEVT